MLSSLLRLPPSRSSCRCISCLSPAANGVLRRPKPFQLQFNQLTTLFYATIISAAAAADARSKTKRRAILDTAIADAHRSLHTNTAKEDVGSLPSKYLEEEREVGLVARDDEYTSEEDSQEQYGDNSSAFVPQAQEDSSLLKNVHKQIVTSLNPEDSQKIRRRPQIAESYRVSRTSIYAGHVRRSMLERNAWTPKKLATVELSVAKMTVRFALESYKEQSSSFWDIAGHLDASFRRNFLKSLKALEKKQVELKRCDAFDLSNFEHVQHPQYDAESMLDPGATRELHSALLSIFRRFSNGEFPIQEALNRISYNLMSAPCAPDVRTYNILLSRFSRLEEYAIADIVVDSFLEAHYRPNELIIPTIISHYSRSGNQRGFESFLGKLQGERGGIMLAKPSTPLSGVAASAKRIIKRGEKVVQRMTLDLRIIYAIIGTHLRFDNGPAANSWLATMRRQHIEPDLPLMLSFLKYEIRQIKNSMARVTATWHEIRRTWLSPVKLLQLDHVEYRHAAIAYFTMLHLYKEKHHHRRWHESYEEALSRGFSMQEVLSNKIEHRIPAREIEFVNRVRMCRKILERRYQLLRQDFKTFEIHVMAAKIILSGLPLKSVLALFERHDIANRERFRSWKRARPWLDLSYKPADITEAMRNDKVETAVAVPNRQEAIAQLARKRGAQGGFVYAAREESTSTSTNDKVNIRLMYDSTLR